ncbi:NADPH-cytochrome P450 reductase [Aspergillus luchuensis]|uniref:NADPH-cytochrome P450 reductase n=1 Tax=Aspergillus kawachii TaxID=1069201 RepID=A0A146EZG8_ASPKA|nr:NADPH-cytochrome P450 reductase [Aspergillus luchuensis]
MLKETDPKPAPSCVLRKGLHTAWTQCLSAEEGNGQNRTGSTESTCLLPRNRRFREVDSGASMRTQEHATTRSTSPIGTQDNTSMPGSSQTSIASSQPRPYDLRKAIQPSTRLAGQEWQTAHKRRRTVARRILAESPANTRRVEVTTQPDNPTPGENTQPISNFFEARPPVNNEKANHIINTTAQCHEVTRQGDGDPV